MKIGGYDALSTSNLMDNENIQRKNSTAGDTMTMSAKARPILPSKRRSGSCHPSGVVPVRVLAQAKQRPGEGYDQREEDDHDRRGIADVVIDEGDAVEI